MSDEGMLIKIKESMGITGEYLDNKLKTDMEEVKEFIVDAGVIETKITPGILARGISDLWNGGEFSTYFRWRVTQLSYMEEEGENA